MRVSYEAILCYQSACSFGMILLTKDGKNFESVTKFENERRLSDANQRDR